MAPPQWAYSVENFVSEPDEELVCSICRAVFCEPVMCPCDHVFCRACITKWIQSSRNCPICRKRVSHSSVKQAVPIVKNIIMKLVLNCNNKALGCTAQISVENSEAHVKECQYELVQCRNKPCKDKLFRKDITGHETSDCPHRYVKCKTCGLKMSTSALPEKHDCIRALRLQLRKKSKAVRVKTARIRELTDEIKALKSASQSSEQSLSNASRNFASRLASGLSPDEIMINIAEFESTSSSFTSLSSDDSSVDSIIIFTNSSLDADLDAENTGSDSFLNFMNDNNDSVEYARNESPQDFSELRNAESQTTESVFVSPLEARENTRFGFASSASPEVYDLPRTVSPEAPADHEDRSQSRRPVKRRPTTQKPAKRRFPPASSSSDADIQIPITEMYQGNHGDNASSLGSGPSSEAGPSAAPSYDICSRRCPSKLFQKRTKRTNNLCENNEDSKAVAPSRNAVFERTLALLEQYNLESDPEWLPEYASHRGDTTSGSDTSEVAEFISESSSSEGDSNREDNSNGAVEICNFVDWSFDYTSEEDDDPDWSPLHRITSMRKPNF